MLVLSRKTGEELQIDGGIRIRVLRIAGGKVRIGIEAPRDCRVVRSELNDRREFAPRSTERRGLRSTPCCAAALA